MHSQEEIFLEVSLPVPCARRKVLMDPPLSTKNDSLKGGGKTSYTHIPYRLMIIAAISSLVAQRFNETNTGAVRRGFRP